MILKVLKTEYRHSFKDMSTAEMADMLNLWAEMFADDDARLVGAAVKAIIVAGDREHAPNIGTIKEQLRKLTATDEMDEAEAWGRIRKAISNGIYGSKEEFEKLPPVLQKLVGSPSQLRDWAMIDTDELQTVVASNVQRAFRTVQAREREAAKLPADVKKTVEALTQHFAPELSDGR